MDFNQWKPLGRGDPLKNDPTYDYVPPVLDQVQYWVEPALRKPDSPINDDGKKTEILLLGVVSKKPASIPPKADNRRDTFDPFSKKDYKHNPHQRISKPTFSFPSSFFPESILNTLSKFTSKNENKNSAPYTVLMPPPMNLKTLPSPIIQSSIPLNFQELQTQYPPLSYAYTTPPSTSTSFFPSSSSDVSIVPSQLVYHSSSLSDESEWKNKNQYATVASSISWRPTTSKPYVSTTKKLAPFRENIVFNKNLQPPESFIHIEFSPRNYSNNHLIGADSKQNLNFVTPPVSKNTDSLHKGSIYDNSGEIKNSYVKIEKPEFYSTELSSDDVSINTAPLIEIYTHMKHPIVNEDMEMIKKMQTLLPPPTTERPFYKEVAPNPIINALIKDRMKSTTKHGNFLTQTPVFVVSGTTTSTTTSTTTPKSLIKHETTEPSTIYVTETVPTTTESLTTTTTTTTTSAPTTTTTDPFLKYYKNPEDSLNSPVYFVIQGHSKVKTYGPTKQVHGINVQETNEILDDETSQYKVRHLHGFKPERTEENVRLGRSGDLQTLKHVIQTGLGSIPIEDSNLNRRMDVQEAELQFGYNVAEEEEVTSEMYHKGIVEEARKLKF